MISVPNGELKRREMRGREREAKRVLQCVPLALPKLPLLPAPNLPFSSLHESPFGSCFKSLTFNVLYHRSASIKETLILLPIPSSRDPLNSKVFSSFITVFMKTKVPAFKIPHLLGAASPGLSGGQVP